MNLLVFCKTILQRSLITSPFVLNFIGIADPMSVPWGRTHDAELRQYVGLRTIGFSYKNPANWPYLSYLLFSGLLKRCGRLQDCIDFNRNTIARTLDPALKALAYWQIADVYHLCSRWQKQLGAPIQAGLFEPIVPNDHDDWYAKSHEYFGHALNTDPNHGWIHLQLGHLYKDSGQYHEALACYTTSAQTLSGPLATLYAIQTQYFIDSDDIQLMNSLDKASITTDRTPYTAQLTTMTEAHRGIVLPVWPAHTHRLSYISMYQGVRKEIEKTIDFEPRATGLYTHLRNISLSFALVDDRYLLTDTNHLPPQFYKLFAPNIMDYDADKASVSLPNKTTTETIPVIMLGGSTRDHYYHFLFEALASMALIEAEEYHPNRAIVFQEKPKSYHLELLQLIGVCNPVHVETRPATIYTDALQLSCPSNMTVPHPRAIDFLRRKLALPNTTVKRGKRVHITRASVSRGVHTAQQAAFFALLKQYGFDIVDSGTMSITEQRKFFSDVEIFSAEGGAACGNLIFCPSETRAVIIAPSNHLFEIWSTLTSTLGQKLWMCLADPVCDYPQPYYLWNSMDLGIDIHSYRLCLEEMTGE